MLARSERARSRDPEERRVRGRNTPRTGSCIMYSAEYTAGAGRLGTFTGRSSAAVYRHRYTCIYRSTQIACNRRGLRERSSDARVMESFDDVRLSYSSTGIIIIVNRRGKRMERRSWGRRYAYDSARSVPLEDRRMFRRTRSRTRSIIVLDEIACGFPALTLPEELESEIRYTWKNAK